MTVSSSPSGKARAANSLYHGVLEKQMLSRRIRISSRKQMWRALAFLTLVAIAISLALSIIALKYTTTGDPNALHPEHEIYSNVIFYSILIPALVCPVVVFTILATLHDLTLAREELDAIAWKDPLTGLLNRRGFDEEAAHLIAQARESKVAVNALMCDIDNFKQINDTYGHDCGDAAIRHVCDILRAAQDTLSHKAIGRQGGEEFAIMTIGKSPREMLQFADGIRLAVESSPILWEEHRIFLTISLGVSASTSEDASVSSLMSRADKALYEAKKRGKNCVHFAQAAA